MLSGGCECCQAVRCQVQGCQGGCQVEFVNPCRPHLMHFEGTKEGSKSGNLKSALGVLSYLTAQPRYTPRHCTHTRSTPHLPVCIIGSSCRTTCGCAA